jgi:hypothetical protein
MWLRWLRSLTASLSSAFSSDDCACCRRFFFAFVFPLFLSVTGAAPASAIPAVPPAAAPGGVAPQVEPKEKPMVVGLYVNRQDRGSLNIYVDGEEYWFPWKDLLSLCGLPDPGEQSGSLRFETSIGEITFDTAALRRFDGDLYVSFKMLEARFGVACTFDTSLFAVNMRLPWTPGGPAKSDSGKRVKPDIPAPSISLSAIHAEQSFSSGYGSGDRDRQRDLQASGRIAGFVWDAEVIGEQLTEPAHYHLTTLNRHSALRLGTGRAESQSLLNSGEFTGVQFGWGNTELAPFLDVAASPSQESFLNFGVSQYRTIEGKGPPAGVAELRFDDRVISRRLIRLDGTFAFPEVPMGEGYRKTEVWLYERSVIDKPVTVLDYSRSITGRSLDKGKLLFKGGVGVGGNPFANDAMSATPSRPVSFGQVHYGLASWMTVDLALRDGVGNGGSDALFGTLLSIGDSWNASAYGALSNGSYGSEIHLARSGKKSSLSLDGSMYGDGFRTVGQAGTSRYRLHYDLRPSTFLSLSLAGVRESGTDAEKSVSFLRPGGSLTLRRGLRFSVMPGYGQEDNYRYELAMYRSGGGTFTADYEDRLFSASWSWNFSSFLNASLSGGYDMATGDDHQNVSLGWHPGQDSQLFFQFGASRSKQGTGFSASFHKGGQSGIGISLNYRYSMAESAGLDFEQLGGGNGGGKHLFNCGLSWDFGWSGRRLYPVSRSAISLLRGGIVGRPVIDRNDEIENSSPVRPSLLVNGRQFQQGGGSSGYFAGNLRPGLYKVALDPAGLPMGVGTGKSEKIVEVKGGAITSVNIPVFAEYGVAGRVVDAGGQGVAELLVTAMREEGKESSGTGVTNLFGYYRIDGLRRGSYIAAVIKEMDGKRETLAERRFEIRKDYEYDVDLRLP